MWAFDGVGGAVAIGLVTWGYTTLRRSRHPDEGGTGVTQVSGDGSPNVHISGDVHGDVSITSIPTSLIDDIADAVALRLSKGIVMPDRRTPAEVAAAVHAYQAEERKYAFARAVNNLPEEDKIIVTLYYYEGLTLSEIAQVMGVSATTVGRKKASALVRLGDVLTAGEPPPLPPGRDVR